MIAVVEFADDALPAQLLRQFMPRVAAGLGGKGELQRLVTAKLEAMPAQALCKRRHSGQKVAQTLPVSLQIDVCIVQRLQY